MFKSQATRGLTAAQRSARIAALSRPQPADPRAGKIVCTGKNQLLSVLMNAPVTARLKVTLHGGEFLVGEAS